MKVQRNPTPKPVKKTMIQKDRSGKLSDDAFYLIALAMLLKKESGERSIRHYLFSEQQTTTGRTAA
jgi:hypothetical protein